MTLTRQPLPTTRSPHFATLLVMALAPEEIGRRIEQRRKELGWTHRRLADEMDVLDRTVQRWQKGRNPKTGKSSLPRLATLMDLADKMGVQRSYFVEGSGSRRDQDMHELHREMAWVRGALVAIALQSGVELPEEEADSGP